MGFSASGGTWLRREIWIAWHPKKQILAFIDEDEKKNAKANEKGEEAYLKLFSPFWSIKLFTLTIYIWRL